MQTTFAIIKPDAVEAKQTGAILAAIEAGGFRIRAMRMLHLSRKQAEGFYAEHSHRPFFGELVEFMTRSPVVVLALEGEDVVTRYRDLMGATDPAKAAPGTIRQKYGRSIGENVVHGSDSAEAAEREVAYFFAVSELQ